MYLLAKQIVANYEQQLNIADVMSRNYTYSDMKKCFNKGAERGTGNMKHVAFNATGFKEFLARVKAAKAHYVQRTLADYGVVQLLITDPDGIEIEVNFPIGELND